MDIPKHYSLKKDHEDHFLLHDKRDGTSFKVAKKGLHPAHQLKILREVPKFSDGGEKEDDLGMSSGINTWASEKPSQESFWSPSGEDTELQNQKTTGQTFQPPQQEQLGQPVIQDQAAQQAPAVDIGAQASAPQQVAPQQGPRPDQVLDPMAGMPTTKGINSMESQYEKAVRGGANAQMKQNDLMEMELQRQYNLKANAAQTFQNTMSAYQKHAEQMASDIASTKIDPDKYWHDKSTGAKFGSALAMVLGGLGAGLQRSTDNMAMNVLQKAIDRDIDAQKTDLGKKQSLLSDNFRAQGNLAAAEAATRAQYESLFQGKVAQIAAATNNPVVQMAAQEKIMASKERMMPLLQSAAQNQLTMQMRNFLMNGDVSKHSPASYINYVVPEAERAAVGKEIKSAEDTKKMATPIVQQFKQAVADLKNPLYAGGLRRPPSISALEQMLMTTVQEEEGTARQAAMNNVKENLLPGFSDLTKAKGVETKLNTLYHYLQGKSSAPMALANGIDLKRFDSTSPYQPPNPMEGKTAIKGNQKIIMKNGSWFDQATGQPYRGR